MHLGAREHKDGKGVVMVGSEGNCINWGCGDVYALDYFDNMKE